MPVTQLLSQRHETSQCYSSYWAKGTIINATFSMDCEELESVRIADGLEVGVNVISVHEETAILNVPRYRFHTSTIIFILFFHTIMYVCYYVIFVIRSILEH